MGLDQDLYAVRDDNEITLAYWRKFPSLNAWMIRLYEQKRRMSNELPPYQRKCTGEIRRIYSDHHPMNGNKVELSKEDLENLERDVIAHNLPKNCSGSCWGDDDDYKKVEIGVIGKAKEYMEKGYKIFYSCGW